MPKFRNVDAISGMWKVFLLGDEERGKYKCVTDKHGGYPLYCFDTWHYLIVVRSPSAMKQRTARKQCVNEI